MAELLQRLRDRKLVQWALAYAAAAFALLQGVELKTSDPCAETVCSARTK